MAKIGKCLSKLGMKKIITGFLFIFYLFYCLTGILMSNWANLNYALAQFGQLLTTVKS